MGLLMLMFAELDTSSLTPRLRTGMITGIVVVLCPLLFLSLNSGGYWARPALDSPSTSSGDEEVRPASNLPFSQVNYVRPIPRIMLPQNVLRPKC